MADAGIFELQTAREIIRTWKKLEASGILDRVSSSSSFAENGRWSYVKNVSGEEIPAYACMQMTGTTEYGGQNYIDVDKPADADGSAGGFIFNGPNAIEIGGYGVGLAGPVVRALGDGTTATAGDNWSPEASAWTVTSVTGGLFIIIGGDDVATNVVKLQAGIGGGSSVLFRFAMTAAMASSSAAATIKDMAGNTIESSTVNDPEDIFVDLTSSSTGLCIKQGGSYYVIQANCPA